MLPTLESMEKGRENLDIYTIFAKEFATGTVRTQYWRDNVRDKSYSDIINTGDEAMAFLILANNWNVWTAMADAPQGTNKLKDVISNGDGIQQKYMVKEGRGYSFNKEGRNYYIQMYNFLRGDRKENGKKFDNHLSSVMNENDTGKNGKRRRQVITEEMEPVCPNDNTGFRRRKCPPTGSQRSEVVSYVNNENTAPNFRNMSPVSDDNNTQN